MAFYEAPIDENRENQHLKESDLHQSKCQNKTDTNVLILLCGFYPMLYVIHRY